MIISVVVAVVVMMMLVVVVMIMMLVVVMVMMMMIQDYISSNGFPECKQSINAKVNGFRAKYLFSMKHHLFQNHPMVKGERILQCGDSLKKNIA